MMPDPWIGTSGRTVYLIELKYQVGERTWHRTVSSDSPYSVGTQYPLRYNARGPGKINHAGEILGWSDWKKWLTVLCGIGFAAIIIWFENR